ncbi:MAG: Fic family protein [Sphingomonas sp.]|uniref:Fic family protein n=1 Tax=Sphingomonas sp. TaxID=28214 RepID=UPI0026012BC8|nr:Fic family protein [Sphingomonas sp.]MBX3564834.1 Fic family protein [Sphingomonas sp.]
MHWNWQQEDWPHFAYNASALRSAEDAFLKGGGIIVGILHHVDVEARQALAIELISQEAVDSSAIEGELLDRASVQSSLARQLGLSADRRKANAAEAGAAELMADLYRSYQAPLSDKLLFDWHAMLMNGRRDLADVGRYRTHADPMQIVSGPLQAPRVHFEAPPSDRVAAEMERFIEWFNATASDAARPLPAITRAGVAHLWFETIHPFEDGNGRLGRAIAEKALAQSLKAPTLTALAETIHRHRKDYYAALHRASQDNRIDDWLAWFADIVTAAQARTTARVRFLIEKTRMLDRLRDQLNPRQEKALLRMFAEGVDGFAGGLSAQNYRTITDAAPATATRDLAGLVEMGALVRSGELRYARYHLALSN